DLTRPASTDPAPGAPPPTRPPVRLHRPGPTDGRVDPKYSRQLGHRLAERVGGAGWRGGWRRRALAAGFFVSVIRTTENRISTRGDADVVDLTGRVAAAVAEAGIGEGQAIAFVRGSTAAITTMELEPGGVHDLRA